jgi:hypothetical protein
VSEIRVRIGGFCVKGGGHSYTYGEGDGADGCDGWPMFIEIDPEDLHLFPDWIQEHYRYAVAEMAS